MARIAGMGRKQLLLAQGRSDAANDLIVERAAEFQADFAPG
jgi:hypothetical protein